MRRRKGSLRDVGGAAGERPADGHLQCGCRAGELLGQHVGLGEPRSTARGFRGRRSCRRASCVAACPRRAGEEGSGRWADGCLAAHRRHRRLGEQRVFRRRECPDHPPRPRRAQLFSEPRTLAEILCPAPLRLRATFRDPRPRRPDRSHPLRAAQTLGHSLGRQLGRAGSRAKVDATGSQWRRRALTAPSSSTGSPILSRRRGSTGIATMGCLRRITS